MLDVFVMGLNTCIGYANVLVLSAHLSPFGSVAGHDQMIYIKNLVCTSVPGFQMKYISVCIQYKTI